MQRERDFAHRLEALGEDDRERRDHGSASPDVLGPRAGHNPPDEGKGSRSEQPVLTPAEAQSVMCGSREMPVEVDSAGKQDNKRTE